MTQPQDKMRAEFEVLRPDFESLPMFDIDRTLLQKDAEGDYVYEPVQGMWIGYGLAHAYPSAQSQQDALDAGKDQHARDSAELRSLCAARDEARRARDMLIVENAGLTASVGHLSRLVDEQQSTLLRAKDAMTALHNSASPVDESRGDLDARIPASDFHKFVDEHAALIHAIAQSPVAIAAQGASNV